MAVIEASAWFPDQSELQIFEHIEVTDRPHRRKYSYHWIPSDTREWIRFDFVGEYEPALQYHINRPALRPGGPDEHIPDRRRTLREVRDMIWTLHGNSLPTRTIPVS